MDGSRLQGKIYKGSGKAATKIGFDYDVYRPIVTPVPDPQTNEPLLDSRWVGKIKVSLNQKGDYKVPNTYGVAIWWSYHDGRVTLAGDYLVGNMGIFFIASQQDLLPLQCVQCNRIIDIIRPTNPDGKGAVGYGGQVASNDVMLMSQWPASILIGRDEKNDAKLPLDSKTSMWKVLLPDVEGINLRMGDQIKDDLDRRYAIQSAELTDLGWRITALQLQA